MFNYANLHILLLDRSEHMIKPGAIFFFSFCLHTRWKKKVQRYFRKYAFIT